MDPSRKGTPMRSSRTNLYTEAQIQPHLDEPTRTRAVRPILLDFWKYSKGPFKSSCVIPKMWYAPEA